MRRSAGVAVILGLVSSILVMAPNAHATVTNVTATCYSGLGLSVFPTSVTVSELWVVPQSQDSAFNRFRLAFPHHLQVRSAEIRRSL